MRTPYVWYIPYIYHTYTKIGVPDVSDDDPPGGTASVTVARAQTLAWAVTAAGPSLLGPEPRPDPTPGPKGFEFVTEAARSPGHGLRVLSHGPGSPSGGPALL